MRRGSALHDAQNRLERHVLYLLTEMHHNVCLLSMTLREKGPAVSTQHHKVIEDERGTSRLEAFSDGVMAVAITLLVLDLHVPDVKAGLFEALLRQWLIYLGYVTSFLVIGILWLHHHHIFKYIKRTDHVLLFLNMLLLMGVALIPFVTALLTRYLNQQEEKTAALMYSGTFLLTTILFNVLWGYAGWPAASASPRDRPTGDSQAHQKVSDCTTALSVLVAAHPGKRRSLPRALHPGRIVLRPTC